MEWKTETCSRLIDPHASFFVFFFVKECLCNVLGRYPLAVRVHLCSVANGQVQAGHLDVHSHKKR